MKEYPVALLAKVITEMLLYRKKLLRLAICGFLLGHIDSAC